METAMDVGKFFVWLTACFFLKKYFLNFISMLVLRFLLKEFKKKTKPKHNKPQAKNPPLRFHLFTEYFLRGL